MMTGGSMLVYLSFFNRLVDRYPSLQPYDLITGLRQRDDLFQLILEKDCYLSSKLLYVRHETRRCAKIVDRSHLFISIRSVKGFPTCQAAKSICWQSKQGSLD